MTSTSNTINLTQNLSVTDRSQQFLHELVKILYYQPIYIILTGHALTILITVVFLWGTVPHSWLLVWSCIMLVLTMTWVVIIARFRANAPPAEKANRALQIFPISGTLTGSFWGLTAFFPNVFQDASSTVFLSIMVLGVTAAGLAVFAPYLRSFVAFASFSLMPFVVRFFLEDSKLHWTLGVMFLLYLIVILISGYNMKRAVRQSIDLRLENLELVDGLIIKNTQAEQAREKAVQADISKSKFLAAASHDLRQPLHALGLFVDALESRIHYPEVRGIVDNIRISTDALSDLLNSLLDISKLDAGVLEPKTTDFQLRPVLQRIQTDFSELASSKSLSLRIVDCGLVINTDPSMLERILRNLVSNAIRYTQQGSVLLGCRRQGNRVSIEIHDTGVGITADEIDYIFEEFYQIENPERDRRKGLGLGLAIVKRLADLIDCPITVSSTPNKGSVFNISVPYVASGTSDVVTTQQNFVDDLKGTRVLIIDDEAMIRVGMRKVLEEWGCDVKEAESIEQALEVLNEQCEIDIILTDYRLRENATGIEAIHRIHDACGNDIPAIILTGDTDPQRIREAKDSGFKLLHKPISSAKLRSLMSYLLDNK